VPDEIDETDQRDQLFVRGSRDWWEKRDGGEYEVFGTSNHGLQSSAFGPRLSRVEEKGVSLSSLLGFSHEPGLTGVTYPITLLA